MGYVSRSVKWVGPLDVMMLTDKLRAKYYERDAHSVNGICNGASGFMHMNV